MKSLDALYYPFSRCIDVASIKQLLLLFDSVTFLDPVDDEYWRSKLLKDVEREHSGFRSYRELGECMPWLRSERIIRVVNPDDTLAVDDHLTTAATLSDLSDQQWTKAADPQRYGLPTQYFGNTPCWNIFRPKISDIVADTLSSERTFKHHLLRNGGDRYAWVMSYAAGSAISINVHLAAAEELGLAPITDSKLHHELMLMKLTRELKEEGSALADEKYSTEVARRALVRIIDEVLPAERMEGLSLEDIVRFRNDTSSLRDAFIDEIHRSITSNADLGDAKSRRAAETKIVDDLIKRAKAYKDEIADVRDRLWPSLMGSASAPVSGGASIAGLTASYISGSGYVLAASVLLYALQPITAALNWQATLKKTQRSASSSVAYLSQVSKLGR